MLIRCKFDFKPLDFDNECWIVSQHFSYKVVPTLEGIGSDFRRLTILI